MNIYRHILLALDFSEPENDVIKKARQLAETFRAKLSILHVLDDIPMPDTPYGTKIPLEEDSRYELLESEKLKFKKVADELGVGPTCRWMVWGVGKVTCRVEECRA